MEKLVSIITPCYNSEKYLKATFNSIQNQTYQNWEWIIVDDCSTDDSIELIKSFGEDRIKLLANEVNSGASLSRNKALKSANGIYITFIDSDDLWESTFLEDSINFLISNNEVLVYSSYKRVDENLNHLLDDFQAIDKVDYNRILYNCPIPMLTSVYDSSVIGKIYFPNVDLREDHAMWIEVLKRTKYARAINKSLGIYRIRDNSVSRNKYKIAIKQFGLYYNYMNFNIFKSSFFTISWAINGLKKYGKF